ncbi:hypothetical protein ES703_72977 [subsurface metagenome]
MGNISLDALLCVNMLSVIFRAVIVLRRVEAKDPKALASLD